jgi:hypothetical protein
MRPMSRIPTAALLIVAVLIAAPSFAATTAKKAPPKLTVESLPAAVQKTVHAESDSAVIRGISKEKGEGGKWVYEIETMVKDMSHDYIVAEDGTVLTSERQVKLESLPEAARATLTKAAGKNPIRIIESVTKAGKLEYYEAQVGSAKASKEIKVSPEGALVK